MLSPNTIALLEDAVAGRLRLEEERALWDKLKESPESYDEAKLYVKLIGGLQALELDGLESDIKVWEQKHQASKVETPTKVISLSSRIRKIAIAAAILVLPVGLYMTSQGGVNPTDIYENHFSTQYILDMGSFRSVNNGDQDTYLVTKDKAFAHLFTKEYTEARTSFEPLLEQPNTVDNQLNVRLGYAIALMGERAYQEALNVFSEINAPDEYGYIQEHVEWYTALINIKLENLVDAKRAFTNIGSNEDHTYKSKAKEILKELQ